MNNPFNTLLQNIINYFAQTEGTDEQANYRKFSTLIRIHHEKLSQCGDISFPSKQEIWRKYFTASNLPLNEAVFEVINRGDATDEEIHSIFRAAKKWAIPLQKLTVKEERILLHLNRPVLMESLVKQCLRSDCYGLLKKENNKVVYLQELSPDYKTDADLSLYRTKLVHNVLQRVLKYSRWTTAENNPQISSEECVVQLQVRSIASRCEENNEVKVIKCGLVTDFLNNGKLCQMPPNEYFSLRSNDMTLTALHKYGVRVKQDARFCALMERLGVAAVTVDLLEVKNTSPVQVIRNGQGSTKGASFILYNSARLETLLRTFDRKTYDGGYEPFIPLNSVQWNLLKEEEEWQLVYTYIAGFPNLIDRCTEQLAAGISATHLIIHFLHGLVATFSVYYRRIRILTDDREHLVPFVYARMYLIKAVREVLNKTLGLLNIEPIDFM